ncbi:MAG: hypothetical protein Q9170_007446 [Blastenia crenularia]
MHVRDIIDRDRFWQDQFERINDGYLFSVRTKPYADFQWEWWLSLDKTVYAPSGTPVLRVYEGFGVKLLLLRSLQDKNEWTGPWSNGSEEWTPEWIERLQHTFADQQLFWIEYKDLLRKYIYIDRTRIFGDDWTVAQRWVTVEVERDDDHQDTSFVFTLYQSSLVVLSLSQLDSRYYCGLEGLYRFQLHFHVYTNGGDDLIAVSRGNYLGSRSVSTECELSPGRYKVQLQVSATKLDSAKSVTQVIAENARTRRTKLIQAGVQYDIAHAKALGWRPLRAKQAQREREATERRRKAQKSEKIGSSDSTVDSGYDDEEDDAWNAICAIGLKVFSHDPKLELEVNLPSELQNVLNETSDTGTLRGSESK